jgi:glycosyltransferase involved in cell wall biosynthesis
VEPVRARTAIVHDWFAGPYGAERAVDAIRAGLFPPENPPDILTFYAARERLPAELTARIVREARLTRSPAFGGDRWRYLFPLMGRWFESLDLSAYDLVVSSSHSFAHGVRRRRDAVHVCYCHTPSYYAWREGQRGGAVGLAARGLRGPLRAHDLRASRRPDVYVANSTAVGDRIRRFYGRDATVVHPPVDVEDFAPAEKEPGSFLWIGRLVTHKQPLLAAEAFRGLPHRLTMVGVGPLEAALRRDLPPNVELVPWLSREELAARLARAAGFVHVGEEDFGIAMVEALAAGAPVVGLARVGARDIVRPEIDGVLVERQEPGAVREAVTAVAERSWDATALATRAREFSRERFLERFRAVLATVGV